MSGVRVYLGGEGPNDLGSRAGHPAYQNDDEPGVIVSLLRRVRADGWTVGGAKTWKSIRKLKARGPTPKEEQNVLGLVLAAKDAQCQVAAFVRDEDDDHGRIAVITAALEKARLAFPSVDVIGGTAVPVLEGWLLAMLDVHGTEDLSKVGAQRRLADDHGVPEKHTPSMTRIVDGADLARLPPDATTLRAWVARAEEVLPE